MPQILRVETSGLREALAAIRSADRKLANTVVRELRSALEPVKRDVQAAASWSTRIPGSVRVSASGRQVSLVVGGKRAPHAAAFEHQGKPGTFRHPVYGHRDRWVAQQARPMAKPAVDRHREEITRRLADVVQRLIARG